MGGYPWWPNSREFNSRRQQKLCVIEGPKNQTCCHCKCQSYGVLSLITRVPRPCRGQFRVPKRVAIECVAVESSMASQSDYSRTHPNMIPSRSSCQREHAHGQCQDSEFAADQYFNIRCNPLLSTLPNRRPDRCSTHLPPVTHVALHVGHAVPSISIPPWAGGVHIIPLLSLIHQDQAPEGAVHSHDERTCTLEPAAHHHGPEASPEARRQLVVIEEFVGLRSRRHPHAPPEATRNPE